MRFQGRFQLDDLASSAQASPWQPPSTMLHPCLGSTAPAPGSAHGPGRPGRIVVRRAALVRALAWAHVGLPPWAGRPVGPAFGGVCIQNNCSSWELDFRKQWQFAIIIEQKIIAGQLPISPRSCRAHRDLTADVSGSLRA